MKTSCSLALGWGTVVKRRMEGRAGYSCETRREVEYGVGWDQLEVGVGEGVDSRKGILGCIGIGKSG